MSATPSPAELAAQLRKRAADCRREAELECPDDRSIDMEAVEEVEAAAAILERIGTQVKHGTVRVAIYKTLPHPYSKKPQSLRYWASCDCGWTSINDPSAFGPSDEAARHLIDCEGFP